MTTELARVSRAANTSLVVGVTIEQGGLTHMAERKVGQRAAASRTGARRRAASAPAAAPATSLTPNNRVMVVNIIPQSLSGERHHDSEPNLAVNPANPLQMAASAFTPNPTGAGNAPIYVSHDGGQTWTLNAI